MVGATNTIDGISTKGSKYVLGMPIYSFKLVTCYWTHLEVLWTRFGFSDNSHDEQSKDFQNSSIVLEV